MVTNTHEDTQENRIAILEIGNRRFKWFGKIVRSHVTILGETYGFKKPKYYRDELNWICSKCHKEMRCKDNLARKNFLDNQRFIDKQRLQQTLRHQAVNKLNKNKLIQEPGMLSIAETSGGELSIK